MRGAVIPCDCYSRYQDQTYGQGQRVHNYAKAHPTKSGGWRCTVCGKLKDVSVSKLEEHQ